ncbi:MAG: hypothetical protein IJH18_04540 [Bacilli bacterium]|nr:hypothetical protein [Bacilli bacterium]
MNIKNKFSKSKHNRRREFYSIIIGIKKSIRKKTSCILPLTKRERFLYDESFVPSFKDHLVKPKGKYLKLTDIILLNTIHKKDFHELYKGIIKLYKDNYLKGYFGGELKIDDLEKCINSFSFSTNDCNWSHLCKLTPRDTELAELCDYIDVSMFEVSNDILGLVFQLNVTKLFNKKIETIINRKNKKKIICDKYNYVKKHLYSKYTLTDEQIRNSEYEDLLLEFKCRFNSFFNKYLPLQHKFNEKPPISLNFYQTNIDSIDRKESYITSLKLIEEYGMKKIDRINLCIRNNATDDFRECNGYYSISLSREKVDRSNNIFFVIDDRNCNIIHSPSNYINLYISSLTFFLLDEMREDLTNEKYKLYNCSSKKIKKNYKQYDEINRKFHKYSFVFNNIKEYQHLYSDEYLKKGFEHIIKIYNEYNEQYNILQKEYEFRTNINNIRSSYILAKVSIGIALLALLLSIYFEYKTIDNKQSKNDNEHSVTLKEKA